jgi:hypothetical protein
MPRAQFWANQWDQALKMPVNSVAKTWTGAGAAPYSFSAVGSVPITKSVTWTEDEFAAFLDFVPLFPLIEVYFEFYSPINTGRAAVSCPAWSAPAVTYTTTKLGVNGDVQVIRSYIQPQHIWSLRDLNGGVLSVSLALTNSGVSDTTYCNNFQARLFSVQVPTRPLAWGTYPGGLTQL